MRIWKLNCNVNEYENLQWETIDLELNRSFDGRSHLMNWNPIRVNRMYKRNFGNCFGLSPHVPVFDDKTVELLKPLLKETEILPLDFSELNVSLINVKVLDCIDYEKSVYKTYSDGKRIMRFESYEFNGDMIKDKHIFKIKDEPLGSAFVSDSFRNEVIKHNLKGFIFELVWDDEKVSEATSLKEFNYDKMNYNHYFQISGLDIEAVKSKIKAYLEISEDISNLEIAYVYHNDDLLLKLPQSMDCYTMNNLVSWVNHQIKDNCILLCGEHQKNFSDSYMTFLDQGNPYKDTLVGVFKDGQKFECYLPECFDHKKAFIMKSSAHKEDKIREIMIEKTFSFELKELFDSSKSMLMII